eukprot:g9977.t1
MSPLVNVTKAEGVSKCYLGSPTSFSRCDGIGDFKDCLQPVFEGIRDVLAAAARPGAPPTPVPEVEHPRWESVMEADIYAEDREQGVPDAEERFGTRKIENPKREDPADGTGKSALTQNWYPRARGEWIEQNLLSHEVFLADAALRRAYAACKATQQHFNRQALGARVRWMQQLLGNKNLEKDKFAMRFFSWHGVMGGICYADDNVSFCPHDKQISERQYRRNRFRYRIGHQADERSVNLCADTEEQRQAVERTQFSFRYADGRDLADKALLKLRGAIPLEWRSGRFLNFGIGTCSNNDPLFFKQRLGKYEPAMFVEMGNKKSKEEVDVSDHFVGYAPSAGGLGGRAPPPGDREQEESSFFHAGGELELRRDEGADLPSDADDLDDPKYSQPDPRNPIHDLNDPPLHGFGFELFRSVASQCSYPNTTIILSKVTLDNLPQLLGKTKFFPNLLVERESEAFLRKNPSVDARILTEAAEVHSGALPEFKGYPRPEVEVTEFDVDWIKTTEHAPDLLETRDELEELVESLGGRETLWELERELNSRPFGEDSFEAELKLLEMRSGRNRAEPGGKHGSTAEIKPNFIEYVILDLDAYDYQVLEFLVSSRQPVLIYRVELAQHFPPPYKYAMLYHETKVDLYREHMRYDEDMYFSPIYGMSLSAALSLLEKTHYLLYLDGKTDAIFVHKKLKPYVQKLFSSTRMRAEDEDEDHVIQFPVDEFMCYRSSHLWHQMNQLYVRSWAFNEPVFEGLQHIHDNITWFSPVPIEEGNVPFLLWV